MPNERSEIPKTSVIILSYNTLMFTKLVLHGIKKFMSSIPFEVIMLDQGSKDGSAEWLRSIDLEANPWLKIITAPYNLMFSSGNNVMRFYADPESEYLLLLNNDVSINEPGWLEERILPMMKDKNIGATGTFGNCHDPEGGGKFFVDHLVEDICDGDTSKEAEVRARIKKLCIHPNGKINEITGWSLGTPMKLWDELGGLRFDGKNRHMWSDSEYCMRVQLSGYKLDLQPYSSKTTHFSGLSHSAMHDPKNYDARAEKIRNLVEAYEKTHSLIN